MGRREWGRDDPRDECVLLHDHMLQPHFGERETCMRHGYSHMGACSTTVDPATKEALGTVPEMGLEETKAAIAAASKAFQTWGKTTAKVRPFVGRI